MNDPHAPTRTYAGLTVATAFAPDGPPDDGPPVDRRPGDRADQLLHDLAEAALVVAVAVAGHLAAAFGQARTSVDTKSSATDMVSEVDRQAETLVADLLAGLRPDDAMLGEEGTDRAGTSGVRWVVDPLDGTTNFLFGIPAYSVSVAAELRGVTVVGVVIDPERDETWTALAGRGARCNGGPVAVADGRSEPATALVTTGFGYRPEVRRWQGGVAARLLPEVRDLRRFGSAALDLCWAAAGRIDGYYEWGLNPWDLAAGELIAAEAGATVATVGGTVVVAPPSLHPGLLGLLDRAGALDPPDVVRAAGPPSP